VVASRGGRRLGIFGGTFDPLHLGHLVAAQDVLEALSLDRVLFVPARRSPHRPEEPRASSMTRLRMVQSAIEGDQRFEVRDLELRRESPSFTVDTLRRLADEEAGSELFLIIGADQWSVFSRWREPAEIVRLAELAVMTRGGERPIEAGSEFGADGAPAFVEVPVTRVDVSATLVRERAAAGRSTRYLVPEEVRRIIETDHLYL
jgi:nicotinate-nucleotide adenylyltransferase